MNEEQLLAEVAMVFQELRGLVAVGNFVWYEAAEDYESNFGYDPEVYDKSVKSRYYQRAEAPDDGAAHFAKMALRLMEPPSRMEDVAAFAQSLEARVATSLPLNLGVSATVRQARALLKRLHELAAIAAKTPCAP